MKKEHDYCLRCGRKLKNPIAREKGYGAVCERKMTVERSKHLFNVEREDKENEDVSGNVSMV